MLRKIGLFLCALILIPTITNAKLNEIEKVKEINMIGKVEYYSNKITVLDHKKQELIIMDNYLNIIDKYNLKENFGIIYFEKIETYIEYNELTGEVIALDKNLKKVNSIIISGLEIKNFTLIDNYIVYKDYENQIQKIYDKQLKNKTTLNIQEEIKRVAGDRILTSIKNSNEETYKLYNMNGQLINEMIIKSTERLEMLSDGSLISITENSGNVVTAYDKDLNKINELKDPYLVLAFPDFNDNIYTIFVDPNNLPNENDQNIEDIVKKFIFKKYSKDLKKSEQVTLSEILNIRLDKVGLPNFTIKELIEVEKILNNNPDYITEKRYLAGFEKYNDEIFILTYKYNDEFTYIGQISLETGEMQEKKIDIIPETDSIGKKIKKYPAHIKANKDGIIIGLTTDSNDIYMSEYTEELEKNTFIIYKVIKDKYEIKTQVKGKGSIVVDKLAKPGDKVQFTVTPDKGYVIDKIYIVDASGNKKEITNKDFIMPTNDVTIEVIFNTKNPETNSFVSYITILFAISIIMIIYINRKKDKTIRYKI